jgi:hypothetical protein
MPRKSLERIALARLLAGGCAVLLGASVLMQQAQAEHSGGGGGIPVRASTGHPYVMPQPRSFTPALPPPAPAPRYSVTTPAKERLAHTAAASRPWTPVSRTQPADEQVRSLVVGPTPGCAWRRGWDGTWFRTSPCS